jgi:hypothetical protein
VANEHLVNDSIDELRCLFDVIVDEYGNYYELVGVTHKGGKLTEARLSNMYFEKAFSRTFTTENVEEYKYQHIGVYLQDLVNSHIDSIKDKRRTIYSIKDLLANGTKIKFLDQTVRHPRSRPLK